MTLVQTNMIPDGIAAAPGLAFESDPSTGFFKKAGGQIGITASGTEVGVIGANGLAGGVQCAEVTFTEDGGGTYTGTVEVPAGATLVDIVVHATALWTAGTSATMDVGDDDPNGYFASVNLKATDLLAGESLSFANAGGKAGAKIANSHVIDRYSASARDITGVIVSSGAGTAGRTRMTVYWSIPTAVAAVKS